jgi:hypothetical protein
MAADVGDQLGPRGGEELALAGAPVDAREKLMLPRVRAEATPNPFPWRI